jgi:hypothetical protein
MVKLLVSTERKQKTWNFDFAILVDASLKDHLPNLRGALAECQWG